MKAVGRYVRVQPRKVRIVADKVRGAPALRTATVLQFHPSKAAKALRKVLVSAIANAENNLGLSAENLKIAQITVDEGPRLKRIQPRAMGRAFRILKKTSHITVVVEEAEVGRVKKGKATKAKPRPTFAEPKKGKAKPKSVAAAQEPEVEEVVTTPKEPVAEAAVPEAPAPADVAEEAESSSEANAADDEPVAGEGDSAMAEPVADHESPEPASEGETTELKKDAE